MRMGKKRKGKGGGGLWRKKKRKTQSTNQRDSVVFVRVADHIRIESLPMKLIIITAVTLKRPTHVPSHSPPPVRYISSLNSGLDTKIQTETVPVANDDNDLAMMTTDHLFFLDWAKKERK